MLKHSYEQLELEKLQQLDMMLIMFNMKLLVRQLQRLELLQYQQPHIFQYLHLNLMEWYLMEWYLMEHYLMEHYLMEFNYHEFRLIHRFQLIQLITIEFNH
jgi:hypothetical protein